MNTRTIRLTLVVLLILCTSSWIIYRMRADYNAPFLMIIVGVFIVALGFGLGTWLRRAKVP